MIDLELWEGTYLYPQADSFRLPALAITKSLTTKSRATTSK